MALSFLPSTFSRLNRSLPVPLSILTLAMLVVIALFSYGFSLRTAIGYAVEREDIMERITLIRASITTLDNTYGSLAQGLSVDHAKSLGFHEVADPLYISVSSAPQAVGLRAR